MAVIATPSTSTRFTENGVAPNSTIASPSGGGLSVAEVTDATDMTVVDDLTVGETGSTGATLTVITKNANAFDVGRQGATAPAFKVDSSATSSATGIEVVSAAAASGVTLRAISSGTNENLAVDAKGSGTITLGGTSTGAIALSRAATALAVNITSASANALTAGRQGTTAPAFNVDAATASSATGVEIVAAAAAGGVSLRAISSGTDEAIAFNAKGAGAIAIGSVSTGAVTITPATTVTGALTPTGGVVAAGGFAYVPSGIHTGGITARVSTDGTDATPSVTETYVAVVSIPANATVTGISIFNGSATGSGNVTAFLANSTGTVVASSASTAISGTDVFQRVPLSSTYDAKGPATYYVATQYGNTSSRFNTHAFGDFRVGKITSTVYGTLVSFTPPTTFTADLGPIASLY